MVEIYHARPRQASQRLVEQRQSPRVLIWLGCYTATVATVGVVGLIGAGKAHIPHHCEQFAGYSHHRNFYEATGGQSQRWESLGNLGAAKADAAGFAYAVERTWLIISGGLHSVSLAESGRQRLRVR
jgi:hypothetical protein